MLKIMYIKGKAVLVLGQDGLDMLDAVMIRFP